MHPVRGHYRRPTPRAGGTPKEDPEMQEIMKMIGTPILERYRVTDFLGKGGMGIVYLAKVTEDVPNLELHRGEEVAIKIISPRITDARMLERFNREVEATVLIDHPNVIDVYEVNKFGTKKFCSMEVLRGVDLEKVLKSDGPLPWNKLKGIMLQACAGVSAAHTPDESKIPAKPAIIHRDLKPSNIFLIREDGNDRVKVLDFGLAKFMENQPGNNLTQEGFIVGTPEYLAPEQTLGVHNYDHRVDVYAIGVIMYKMLTGKLPFKHEDLPEMINLIRKSPPLPPRTINPDIPQEVEDIILKALAKKPDQRFQTMDEMIEAIERTGGPARYKGSVVSDDLLLDLVRDSEVPKTPDGSLRLDRSMVLTDERPAHSEETEVLLPRTPARKRKSGAAGSFFKAVAVLGVLGGIGYAGYHYRDRYMPYVERQMQRSDAPAAPSASAPETDSSFMANIGGTPGAYVYEIARPGSRERNHLGNIPAGGSFNYRFGPGEHILVIAKPGFASETVRVSEAQPSRTVSLSPRRARPRTQAGDIEVGEPEISEPE